MMQAPQPVDPGHFAKLYEQAFAERAAQYGERDARTLEVARNLGLMLLRERQPSAADSWLRRALSIAEGLHPEHSAEIAVIQEALALATSGDSERRELHRQASRCVDPAIAARNLAKLAALEGNDIPLLRQALAKQEQAPALPAELANRLNDLGLALQDQHPAESIPLFRRALLMQERHYGPKHPETATTLNNLANSLGATGQTPAAEPLLRRALAIFEATLGFHERTGITASNLAEALTALGRPREAKAFYARAAAIFADALGAEHPWAREAAQNAR
jgi:tetratricopeptide (TPR) repeat protein